MSESKLCGCGCGEPVRGRWKQGHNPKTLGKKFTDEHRRRISESNKGLQAGDRHPNYGKHLSAETRRKIGEAHRGRTVSLETRRKISETKLSEGASQKRGAIHNWLSRWYPKTGVCEECGSAGKTNYASLTHHLYTRRREDYAELCHSCHIALDYRTGQRPSQAGIPKPRHKKG